MLFISIGICITKLGVRTAWHLDALNSFCWLAWLGSAHSKEGRLELFVSLVFAPVFYVVSISNIIHVRLIGLLCLFKSSNGLSIILLHRDGNTDRPWMMQFGEKNPPKPNKTLRATVRYQWECPQSLFLQRCTCSLQWLASPAGEPAAHLHQSCIPPPSTAATGLDI